MHDWILFIYINVESLQKVPEFRIEMGHFWGLSYGTKIYILLQTEDLFYIKVHKGRNSEKKTKYMKILNYMYPIAKVVSSNSFHDELYLIQHYVIKFVSDLRQVLWFPPPLKLTTTI
jgi:hypothetical protein